MSKAQRWRAAGRHWVMPNGQLNTTLAPGAKTVEQLGRQLLHNKRNPLRWHLAQLAPWPDVRQALLQRHHRARRVSLGREFYRKLWRAW